jgi:cytosine/adenosine deaminase-related metal-dependent hydrolase
MQFISADIVFPVNESPIKHGIIAIDDEENIAGVFASKTLLEKHLNTSIDIGSIKQLKGFLCPGFVNAHCHLELTYLKNQLKKHTQLTGFIQEMLYKRNTFSLEEITASIKLGGELMLENGIVAVGDISNSDASFAYKNESPLLFHTFIEVLDLNPKLSERVFSYGCGLLDRLRMQQKNTKSSLVPHAPYTTSPGLIQRISEMKNNEPVSIHNQETISEDEIYKSLSGKLFYLFSKLGYPIQHINQTGKSSIKSYSNFMNSKTKTVFVHNTFTKKSDIVYICKNMEDAWWCFCPKANLFIENKLPDVEMIISFTDKIVLGTDSLASNDTLSILEEMKVLSRNFENISLTELIKWATWNGARFLGMDEQVGTLAKNKKPGINLIEHVDVQNQKLTAASTVKKII